MNVSTIKKGGIILLISFVCSTISYAQTTGLQQIITNPEDFKWWTTSSDASYTSVWKLFINNQVVQSAAPWDLTQSGTSSNGMGYIRSTQDYLPEKGWELVQFDLGVVRIISPTETSTNYTYPKAASNRTPHFILYNKYKAVIRFFLYNSMDITQNTGSTGKLGLQFSIVTDDNGISPNNTTGILYGTNNAVYKPADEFLVKTSTSPYLVVSRDTPGGSGGWSYFDIPVDFDPYLTQKGNVTFVPKIKWELSFLTEQNIQATTSSSSQSMTAIANEYKATDFNTYFDESNKTEIGTSTPTTGDKILTTLEKTTGYLGKINYDELGEKINESTTEIKESVDKIGLSNSALSKSLAKLIEWTKSKEIKTKLIPLENGEGYSVEEDEIGENGKLLNLISTLGKVNKTIGAAYSIFNTIGSTFGWFTEIPEMGYQPELTITKSTGNISGTITSNNLQWSNQFAVPGVVSSQIMLQSTSSGQRVYNNTPFGIYTLNTSPKYEATPYYHLIGVTSSIHTSKVKIGLIQPYKTLKFSSSNSLKLMVNEHSGLQLKESAYSMVFDMPINSVITPSLDGSIIGGTQYDSFQQGNITNLFDHKTEIYTLSGIRFSSTNLRSYYNPILREIEEGRMQILKIKKDVDGNDVYEISTSYYSEKDFQSITPFVPLNATNFRIKVRALFQIKDSEPVTESYKGKPVLFIKEYPITIIEKTNNDMLMPQNFVHYNYPLYFNDVSLGANQNYYPGIKDITINTPTSNGSTISVSSITLSPGFESIGVYEGKIKNIDFIIPSTTSSNISTEYVTSSIHEKNTYYRTSEHVKNTTSHEFLTSSIYPNPSTGSLYIPNLLESSNVEVLNLQGMAVRSATVTDGMIDISDLSNGSYIIRYTHDGSVSSQLIQLVK